MCGIVGAVAFTDKGESSLAALARATDRLRSRGPDNGAVYLHGSVAVGHRRLSIIDTSRSANQPMTDESGRYTIVYNGEIYNFRELRRDLERDGTSFVSHSDTEVVLKLFIKEGETFLRRLHGFFAFAIHDNVRDTVFVARDRFGIKPLYYYFDDDCFIFASEMKAMMEFAIPRELDEVSLYQYLQLSYIPAPHTIFKRVFKLEPGRFIRVADSTVEQKTYYEVPFDERSQVSVDTPYSQLQERLLQLIDASVQERLVSDVPLGAFLSGGIDSSIIVAMAARHVDRLETFSIGFRDEPLYDESRYAKLVADHCGTHHTSFSLTTDDLYACLFDVLDYTDEPFADSSALAVYILSQHTRRHVKVALSGDGADELFAGYNKHVGEFRVRSGGFAAWVLKGSESLLRIAPRSRDSFMGNKLRQLHRFSRGARLSAKERYWQWCAFTDEQDVLATLGASLKTEGRFTGEPEFSRRKATVVSRIQDGGDLNDVLYADTNLLLQNDMLRKVDSMSMANSLEVRVPFLDHRVVDFAFTLPVEYKMTSTATKRILRDTFKPYLPPTLHGRGKHGFEVPLMKWFRTDLRSFISDDVLDDRFISDQGIFDVDAIRQLKQRLFSSRPGAIEPQVWSLIVFQSWWKRYMGAA